MCGIAGLVDPQRSPEALRATHAADVAKWGQIIRDANIKVE